MVILLKIEFLLIVACYYLSYLKYFRIIFSYSVVY